MIETLNTDSLSVDTSEDILNKIYEGRAFAMLLRDFTTGRNIIWATRDYMSKGFYYFDEIQPDRITGKHGLTIRPRALKSKDKQQQRSKSMAEVFTPSWVCNAQNNLVDQAWFGRKDVFNTEVIKEDGSHWWEPCEGKIKPFPQGKKWEDYIGLLRMEISCGEAPYLVSRYDTVSGQFIPINRRIGLLDRKLRVISEHCNSQKEWIKHTKKAFKSIYAYEWQGDSLLLAREALLISFVEYYRYKFNDLPSEKDIIKIAEIISWNIFQMDGFKGVVPQSCKDRVIETDLFNHGTCKATIIPCKGCKSNNIDEHNGIYCQIMDWSQRKKIRFIDLINKK